MTIGEIAARTNISTDTLRYYERIGLIPKVPRKANRIRNYGEYHVQYIAFIQLLKTMGLSLDNIINYMQLAKLGKTTDIQRKNILKETRISLLQKIADLQNMVHQAECQISNYDNYLLPTTNNLVHNYGC